MALLAKLKKNDLIFAENIHVARGFERIKGMMGGDWDKKDGLLINHSNSIHMFFMKFPMDIVFLSSDDRVVSHYFALKPWRITAPKFSAVKVLELPENSLPASIRDGDYVELVDV